MSKKIKEPDPTPTGSDEPLDPVEAAADDARRMARLVNEHQLNYHAGRAVECLLEYGATDDVSLLAAAATLISEEMLRRTGERG